MANKKFSEFFNATALTQTPANTFLAGYDPTRTLGDRNIRIAADQLGGLIGIKIGNEVVDGTANRVLYIDGSGNLADSANLTFSGTQLGIADGTAAAPSLTIGGVQSGLFRSTGTNIERVGLSVVGNTGLTAYRDTATGNNRIGIGTVDPTARLHIVGNGTETGELLRLEDGSGNARDVLLDNGVRNLNYSAAGQETITITRDQTAQIAGRQAILTLRNTSEIVGGDDYQNESHIRLRAGSSARHRRYILFTNFDGNDDYSMGTNAQQNFILYDQLALTHRMWFWQKDDLNLPGSVDIRAVNAGTIRLNDTESGSTETAGTGGVEFYAGGVRPSAMTAKMNANGELNIFSQNNGDYSLRTFRKTTNNLPRVTWHEDGRTAWNAADVSPTSTHVFARTATLTATGFNNLFESVMNHNPSAANASQVSTIYGNIAGQGANRINIVGVYGLASGPNTSALSIYRGGYFIARKSTSAVGAAILGAVDTLWDSFSTGTIDLAFGLRVNSPSAVSGTVTEANGVLINPQKITGVTKAYAIRQNGQNDLNYYFGKTGFGIDPDTVAGYLTIRNPNANSIGLEVQENGGSPIFRTTEAANIRQNELYGNIGFNTSNQFGSGSGVLAVADAATVPTTNPTGAHIYYSNNGNPTFRTSSGEVITLDPQTVVNSGDPTIDTIIDALKTIGLFK